MRHLAYHALTPPWPRSGAFRWSARAYGSSGCSSARQDPEGAPWRRGRSGVTPGFPRVTPGGYTGLHQGYTGLWVSTKYGGGT